MPKVQTSRTAMFYEKQGTGEPLILIPHLAADHALLLVPTSRVLKALHMFLG